MCCLIEKEMPSRGHEHYSSDETFQIDDPKTLMEKAKEYRAASRAIRRKPAKGSSEYRIIKHKRGSAVAAFGITRLREKKPTVLDFMRANRPETIQVFSAVIAAAMILSLASSLLFGVHIVNPLPALLILVTFIGFFLMAKSAERFDVDR
jgi:hypothetical protein